MNLLSREIIEEILEVGTRAISIFNVQPWRFKIHSDSVDIFIIRSKTFFLKLDGVMEIALGALIENISQGALAKGFTAKVYETDKIASLDSPCARIRFTYSKNKEPLDISHVLKRVSDNRAYKKRPIPLNIIDELKGFIVQKSIALRTVNNDDKEYIAKIMADLEGVLLTNARLCIETLRYIRWDPSEIEREKDLLDVRRLNSFSTQTTQLLQSRQKKIAHRIAKLIGTPRRIKKQYKDIYSSSGSFLIFTLEERNSSNLIQLGQQIQCVMNELTRLDLASAPIANGLYLLDLLRENTEIFSNSEKNTLLNCKFELEEFFDMRDRKIVFVLRTGYVNSVISPTLRKPLCELTI